MTGVQTCALPISRKSLWKATKDYEANQYGDAKADLGEAETWLDQAAQSTNTVTRKEAVALKQSIAAVEGKITHGGKQTGSALTSLWDKSVALSEREAELVSTDWGKLRTKSTAKTDLIDAKLHLAYAESAQSLGGKSAEVKSEIDKATADLDAAANTSDKALKAKIATAAAGVKQIRAKLGDSGPKVRARYEKVRSDLRRLIRDL